MMKGKCRTLLAVQVLQRARRFHLDEHYHCYLLGLPMLFENYESTNITHQIANTVAFHREPFQHFLL